MRIEHLIASFLIMFGCSWIGAPAKAQAPRANQVRMEERRKLLAAIREGASTDDVIRILGRPDEIRPVRETAAYIGAFRDGGPEVERWVYGVLGKGMFASVGFVGINKNKKVVAAIATDCTADKNFDSLEIVEAKSDLAVKTEALMSCRASLMETFPKEGGTLTGLKLQVELKNEGVGRFSMRHDAANSLRRFFLVELYDATGQLLFREDNMRWHSPADPHDWPALVVPASKDLSDELFSFSATFGSLPSGKYSVRVFFPFEDRKYYPSNRISFEVPGIGTEKSGTNDRK